MINSKTVRDSFFILLALVRNMLITCVIGVLGYALVNWGISIYPEPVTDNGIIVSFLVDGLQEVLPPAVLLGMVLSIVLYRKKPGIRILSLFFIFAVSGIGLTGALIGTPYLIRSRPGYTLPLNVDEGYIHSTQFGSVFIEEQSKESLSNILQVNSGEKPALKLVRTIGVREIPVSRGTDYARTAGQDTFMPPRFIDSIFRDIVKLNEVLRAAAGKSFLQMILACGSMLFFILAACLLLSLPKWPLYNGIIIVFSLRFFIFLLPFLWSPWLTEILGLAIHDRLLPYAPPAILAAAGIIFLLSLGLFRLGKKKDPEKVYE